MNGLQKKCLGALFAMLTTAAAGTASAHAALQSAVPAKGAELAHSPGAVALHFNEKLESAFSSIKVYDSAGKQVSTGKASVDSSDPSTMTVAVPPLSSGTYTVRFVAVGGDGHRRAGSYSFSVK